MRLIDSQWLMCPYCGESIEIIIDCSIPEQQSIEDCPVCCRPIELYTTVDADGVPSVQARHENDV